MPAPEGSFHELLDLFRRWWGEVFVAGGTLTAIVWRWRSQLATVARRLLAVESRPSPASTSIATPHQAPDILRELAAAHRQQEAEKEAARLLDQFEARLRVVARENAAVYQSGHDRLLGEIQRLLAEVQHLIDALSAERAVRRADVRESRALVGELRDIARTFEGLADAVGDLLKR